MKLKKRLIKMNRRLFTLFLMSLFILVSCEKKEESTLTLSGTVELKDVRISSLVGGRIAEINYDEGDDVKAGEIVAKIDCTDYELQLKQAETIIKGAEAKLALVKKGARREDIAAAKERKNQAEIGYEKAEKEFKRFESLYNASTISEKDFDDVKANRDKIKSQFNQSKQVYYKLVRGARKEDVDVAKANLAQAEAAKNIFLKKTEDCILKSPLDGTVLDRISEPGEVVGAGSPILVIGKLDSVQIQVFVSEKDLGYIRNGDSVEIKTDTYPDKKFTGKVASISSEAEFTPKTILTEDERVKTVYEFKVTADNRDKIFKAGMPVDIIVNKKGQ